MYLYIFEDGSMKQSRKAPKEEDFKAVSDGILNILTINDFMGLNKFTYYDGKEGTFKEVDYLD